jgi:aldehyde dehydrogenase (NAD+)
MLEKREFYINGKWVAPATANDFDVIDPSNEEVCAVISLGGQSDTDAAVAAAKAAFAGWSGLSKEERLGYVEKIFEIYNERAEDMAKAISLEMGAPIDMAKAQQVTSGSYHIQHV